MFGEKGIGHHSIGRNLARQSFSTPVLFLGEWCRLYSQKERWQAMEADVLPYLGRPPKTISGLSLYQSVLREVLTTFQEIGDFP